jgi:hypothetical protein
LRGSLEGRRLEDRLEHRLRDRLNVVSMPSRKPSPSRLEDRLETVSRAASRTVEMGLFEAVSKTSRGPSSRPSTGPSRRNNSMPPQEPSRGLNSPKVVLRPSQCREEGRRKPGVGASRPRALSATWIAGPRLGAISEASTRGPVARRIRIEGPSQALRTGTRIGHDPAAVTQNLDGCESRLPIQSPTSPEATRARRVLRAIKGRLRGVFRAP